MRELDITDWTPAKTNAAIETARTNTKARILLRWPDPTETTKPETHLDHARRLALVRDRLRA
jgi:hypothetical protein